MIEKMRFLSITGPKADIDRVVEKYLTQYPIHLENALAELGQVRNLYPYMETNPYKEWLSKAREYTASLPPTENPEIPEIAMDVEAAVKTIKKMEKQLRKRKKKQEELENKYREKEELLKQITPFRALNIDISALLHFEFIRYRFGKMKREAWQQFEEFAGDADDIIFLKCMAEGDYVWGIYFTPRSCKDKVDARMASLHFERIILPDSYKGNGSEAYDQLKKDCKRIGKKLAEYRKETAELMSESADSLRMAQKVLEEQTCVFDVRKLAACTKERQLTFYILCGWMAETDAIAFEKAIEGDEQVYCFVREAEEETYSKPPTKLKNPKIARPFEMFTRMYGLPGYKEMDPTMFVAITYIFIFGAMFGDLGQGLCLLVGGFALYKWKGWNLAGIIGFAGIFSSIFGILFGSFFGFENVIDAVWLRPKEAMSHLPFIGSLNTVLVVAIAFGMGLILLTMIFQMINAWRSHELGDFLFSTNGLAGFVFYGFLVLLVVLYMTGNKLPASILIVICLGIPVLCLALKEPLVNAIEKRKPLIEGGPVMFVVQTFFELFEVMLSYFSNTLSFVRIGAFAVSHAAMMEVVLMLAGAENGGSVNWIVVVLGNLIVCGMEGLIVGIQVLRLEYYEMFSRYYKGDGREFKPFIDKAK